MGLTRRISRAAVALRLEPAASANAAIVGASPQPRWSWAAGLVGATLLVELAGR